MNHFVTEQGDILPFQQVIRTSCYTRNGSRDDVRVMFVNGSIDLLYREAEKFKESYLKWLNREQNMENPNVSQKILNTLEKWGAEGLPETQRY